MPQESLPAPPSSNRRVEAFRGRSRRGPLNPLERALLAILGVHLCFLPWALGTTRWWAQVVSLALAVAGFVVALQPRFHSGGSDAERPVRLVPWVKLRRFPIFWIGLAVLALIAVQGFNPAYRFVQESWIMRVYPTPHISWLPAGVSAPFTRFNPWRDWIIGASAWMTTCSVWVGLVRRRSLRILLGILSCNGIALGLLGAYQHLTGNYRTPSLLSEIADFNLSSSLIYKNHAGAYYALIAFVTIALATWYFDHGSRRLVKSTPAGVLGLAALFLAGSVLFTLSKGASLILAFSLLLNAAWFLIRRRVLPATDATNPMATGIVIAVFSLFSLNAIRYVDFSRVYSRFDDMAEKGMMGDSIRGRLLVHQADTDMLRDHWLLGVGAGDFRYLFPQYLRNYPDIYQNGRLYWDHAHGDWWEVPIELGVIGDLLLLGAGGWWISWFIRHRVAWNAFSVPLLLGCLQTVIHAGFDFPFQCPAILITWCVLVTAAAKGAEE